MADFFYDGQIRRYILQFIRVFSDFKCEIGIDSDNTKTQQRVPVTYGDPSYQAAQMLRGQSENVVMPSPMMSAWVQNLDLDAERRKDPAFESRMNSIELNHDRNAGAYGSETGNRTTIERYMPVPYLLTMALDIWTTNTQLKLQLLEQILTIFNPSIQLQQNANFYDWSAIFEIELTKIVWSNRTIPVGTSVDRDVASLTFELPIWISPPSKVKRITIINEIVANVFEGADLPEERDLDGIYNPLENIGPVLSQIIVTPGNYRINIGINGLEPNEIALADQHGVAIPTLSWNSLFDCYGNLDANNSRIRLKINPDIESSDGDIIGTVSSDPTRDNILIYTVDEDTLPATIPSGTVDNIINPVKHYPGGTLPTAVAGQRYLLIEDIIPEDTGTNPWESIHAHVNDIIEYNGIAWFVVFYAENEEAEQFVINQESGNHYRFTGDEWVFTYLGSFFPGYWILENLRSKNEQ